MGNCGLNLLLLILLSLSHEGLSWVWFSSHNPESKTDFSAKSQSRDLVADFSIDSSVNPKGSKLVENAKRKLATSNSCWQNAYRNLFSGCSDIISNKEKQSRFAWYLSDCFQRDSGRPPFPSCSSDVSMLKCLKNLDEFSHKIYLEFFLETNSICHQLQTEAFKQETERLVNDLRKSAQFAEDKLDIIEERSEELLMSSKGIHESLSSIDLKSIQIAQTTKHVEGQIHNVLEHSEAIFKQSKELAGSQFDLREGQAQMKEKLESGMKVLHENYENLGRGIEKVREEAMKIEEEIDLLGDSMSMKLKTLQSSADEIGNVAGISLDKQKQLLEGQSTALEGLDFLTKFQSKALEESRNALQKLVELGHEQQTELLQRQEQLQKTHDRLIQNSLSILEAQETFESKQANLFSALDKLFNLHNAILLESRFIKTFFFYSCAIFVVYMLTSAKQTFAVRARLYLGLCITFVIEFSTVRAMAHDFDKQSWVESKTFLARSSFLLLASGQILYSIYTYRDYEVENHNMLLTLMEKIDTMGRNHAKRNDSAENFISNEWEEMENDEISYSWLVDENLSEDVALDEDPDYRFPEEVEENWMMGGSIVKKYDLRPRSR